MSFIGIYFSDKENIWIFHNLHFFSPFEQIIFEVYFKELVNSTGNKNYYAFVSVWNIYWLKYSDTLGWKFFTRLFEVNILFYNKVAMRYKQILQSRKKYRKIIYLMNHFCSHNYPNVWASVSIKRLNTLFNRKTVNFSQILFLSRSHIPDYRFSAWSYLHIKNTH